MLYKMTEWENNGKFYCGCVDDLGHDSGVWYLPCRFLDLSPAKYLEMVITKFKPDHIFYAIDDKHCVISWSWNKQSDMRLLKNHINAAARRKNFQI